LRRANAIYDAKLEAPDITRDLCQLDAPGLASPAPALGSARTLRPGQRLYAIGYGVGNAASISEGLVSAVHDAGTANERIQTTIPSARGLLGAGLYDEEARLVGVITASPKEAATVAFAVPADWVPEVSARGAAALAARNKPAATGGTAGTAGTASSAPGLPTPGTEWTYAVTDRQFGRKIADLTVRVLRADGVIVEEAVSAGGKDGRRVVNASETKFIEHRLSGDATIIEFAPYALARADGKLPDIGPATGYPLGGFSEWNVRSAMQGWESVTVAAGTFKAMRVDLSGERKQPAFTNISHTRTFKVTIWYAPEVKRFVRLEHRAFGGSISTAGQPIGFEVTELTSFAPR